MKLLSIFFLLAAGVATIGMAAETRLEGAGWRAGVGPDGALQSLEAEFGGGGMQPVPLRDGAAAGPAWYVRNGNKIVRPKLTAVAGGRTAYEGTADGIRFHLEYSKDQAGRLTVTATAVNTTAVEWRPETAGIKVGLDCWMAKYPDWNQAFVPTILRCEKTHFWGYAMTPKGRVVAVASPDPVASWSIDYVGDHRISTFNIDLLNAPPLPPRHPQNLSALAPGESRSWTIVLSPLPSPDAVGPWVAAAANAPVFDIDRFTVGAGETAAVRIAGPMLKSLTVTGPDGRTLPLPVACREAGVASLTFPESGAAPGLYTLTATAVNGKVSEASVCVRRPWSWYLTRARLEGLRVKPTATHHAECVYPFYSYFLARKHQPDAAADAECEAVFRDLFPKHYDEAKGELRTSYRIQDSATWAGILADRYAVTHDEKDLEHAAALCDFLILKHQGDDGGFYVTTHKKPVHYTSVIYLAKSVMEVMAVEKPLAASKPEWKARYERHLAAVRRAVDDLGRRGDNLETEGEQTYEDGMISCTVAQLAMYALKLGNERAAAPFLAAAKTLCDAHRCLTMTASPDARVNGATIRYWETKYTICMMANMNDSPCGWSAWKLYADNYLYQLTGEERYLREYFNGLGACVQLVDTQSGRLRWGFTPNPYVRTRYAVRGDDRDPKAEHRWAEGVVGEQYLEQISDWNRSKPIWREKWGIDDFVHEIFKCMEEGAYAAVYLLERPDGTLACYNGTVAVKNGVVVVTPLEPQACRLHLNLRTPHTVRAALAGGSVDGTFNGRCWAGPGGVPPDVRPF